MFLFQPPVSTEGMSIRHSIIIFYGGTKKALLTVSGWARLCWMGCYSFRGELFWVDVAF